MITSLGLEAGAGAVRTEHGRDRCLAQKGDLSCLLSFLFWHDSLLRARNFFARRTNIFERRPFSFLGRISSGGGRFYFCTNLKEPSYPLLSNNLTTTRHTRQHGEHCTDTAVHLAQLLHLLCDILGSNRVWIPCSVSFEALGLYAVAQETSR